MLLIEFVVEQQQRAGSGTSSGSASAQQQRRSLSGTLNGSGSTFQLVYQQAAIQSFKSVQPNMTVNYGGGGSGKGRTDLASGVVNFAGSDSPIPAAETATFKGKTVLYFPVFLGPITVSYNLSGVSKPEAGRDGPRGDLPGQDHDVEQLGDRGAQPRRQPAQHPDHHRRPLGLLGHDAELLPVPGEGRARAHGRSAAARPSSGPPPPAAGNGNGGVAQIIKSTPGAIGYVDYADAKASGLTFASIKNSSGSYVAPSPSSASAAGSGITVATNLTFHAVDSPNPQAYPITYQSWVLVYATQPNANDAAMLKAYIGYLLGSGQQLLANLGYAPLPSSLQQMAQAQLSKITS